MARVGIKDVAKRAGVSPATVSRALAGRVADPELRGRVEQAVLALGYRPNLAARRLRSRETGTVGLIVADIRNPFFTAIASAIEVEAYARGLRVILCNTDEDPLREAMILRLMEEERVSGIILAPTRQTAEAMGITGLSFPAVLIDRSPPSRVHDAVVLDNRGAASLLVEHLHACGYRQIAGLFGAASMTGIERHQGYAESIAALGLATRSKFVAHADGAAEKAVEELLSSDDAPDALIVSNGKMLLSVVRGLNTAGARIPADIALAGFDNEPWTELVGGGLTVIEQPVEQIAREAMTMLAGRIEQPDSPVRKLVLSGRALLRGSTPEKNRQGVELGFA